MAESDSDVMDQLLGSISSLSAGSNASERPDYRIVAAIDLGTKYSGYAFKIRGEEDVTVNVQWDDQSGFNYKTPTCLLLDEDGNFVKFGFSAQEAYIGLPNRLQQKHLYFDCFKMLLHRTAQQQDSFDRSLMVKAANGINHPAMEVFSHSLRHLKEHLIKKIKGTSKLTVPDTDLLWVLTVPAIWNEKAKQFMREAAYSAGMGSEADPRRLIIALEPEAAALYCKKLPKAQFNQPPSGINVLAQDADTTTESPSDQSFLKPGARYMVIDAGGGTIDITVHELLSDCRVKEVFKASGGDWGGEKVDEQMRRTLDEVLGADSVSAVQREAPAAVHDLLKSFEVNKRTTDLSSQKRLNVQLNADFCSLYQQLSGKSVKEAVQASGNKEIGVTGGMLWFRPSLARSLFMPVIDKISTHVKSILTTLSGDAPNTYFLVGGFAGCSLLLDAIRAAVPEEAEVLCPLDPGTAVLKGAIEFGLNPETVRSRIARLTYGTDVAVDFEPGVHPMDRLVLGLNGAYCRGTFKVYVAAEEEVEVGHEVTHPFSPLNPFATHFVGKIISSTSKNPTYTDPPECEEVGQVVVDLQPNVTLQMLERPRPCLLRFRFGGTEITVTAVDGLSGRSQSTHVDFLSSGAE